MQAEPWYCVRLIYHLVGTSSKAYEERVLIVRADSEGAAIAQAEAHSQDYESDTTVYTGYAMAFNIIDQNGPSLGAGVEVFSLIRKSELDVDAYLDRFHDTGSECCRTP
ncbi:hypothetical protein K227x_17210 [Rubripirellula lacrimiformis]|uniref:DUF4288 domain-containing protein n=1 Tax=Rubripirellula lacrimiformis TaxID=1930273 RepID=A0A517N875_9BACT|nr:DUF4288 domain-containing protein [Rubripirellula lacrimiformis]QDT03339.1 hypothetical protein K227x_17210 [Rubripirellula lacrimiformis]